MDNIKFRGKRKDNGEWVYGYYFFPPDGKSYIISGDTRVYQERDDTCDVPCLHTYHNVIDYFPEVLPKTVGMFTGLHDKNDKEGFQKDIVQILKNIYVIEWDTCNACFYLKSTDRQKSYLTINNLLAGIVIGNIHQNPELLKENDNDNKTIT